MHCAASLVLRASRQLNLHVRVPKRAKNALAHAHIVSPSMHVDGDRGGLGEREAGPLPRTSCSFGLSKRRRGEVFFSESEVCTMVDVDCAICLEPLQSAQTLDCGHRFCGTCVASYQARGLNNLCPL